MIKQNHKLGIIVPYRNRYEHLEEFKKIIKEYFSKTDIDYELIIVEQDDAKLFNRGMLLNIGFKYAKKYKCDYVVFHDVDMLPIDVDYSYSDIPLHLSTNFEYEDGEKERTIFDTYFGGVTMFPTKIFESINGYSNKYWGWGFEDDDLLLRCKHHSIELNKIQIKNIGKKENVLKFNGDNAYVESNNVIDLNNDFTITICFCSDNLILNPTKTSDEFTIFSIPGYDFAISYTSFGRYNFCAFDNKLTAVYLNSDIRPTYKTNITITYDVSDCCITMYQDGVFVGKTTPINRFNTRYRKESKFYIGVGNPQREIIPNWFKGTFEYFGYYNKALNNNEIKDICEFGIKSNDSLKTHYNSNYIFNYKLVDLSENNNIGIIHKCEIIKDDTPEYKTYFIPHRRKSLFKSLKHEENGFNGNRWKDDNTRWNQLRFINEVSKNYELLENEGLSDLKFTEHGVNTLEKNVKLINVGI
jgi:hypothetical protein